MTMATQKGLIEIVCDAVRALQEPKGSNAKQIFSYAKEVTQNEEISLKNIKLALKNAVDKEMLKQTYRGRFNLNLPDVPNTEVKSTEIQKIKNEDNLIMELKSNCGCPKKKRRKRKCRPKRRRCSRPRRKRCRSRRRRKSCRSCTKIWVPKRKKRCRSSKRRRSRRRSCKPRRKRRCSSCTPIWVPRKRRCRKR